MKNGILLSALSLSLFCCQSFGFDIQGRARFMPENTQRISKDSKDTNGMTKEKFESIITRVYNSYSPIVTSRGATLVMDNKWDDETVNAYANQLGSTWTVYMFGGLARHPLVTDDGFMLVVCHETGHHLGGAPKYSGGLGWAATEGQADYFGALKCLKRVLEKDDNIGIVAGMTVDTEATNKCEKVYKNANEIALCQRSAMAGKSLALLLGELGGTPNIAFNTPDKSVVQKTNENHPAAQCRLDTYFNASLCDKTYSDDVSNTSPIPGTCIKKDGYKMGPRPLCWYKPGSEEM
jgi:hypothetical protein